MLHDNYSIRETKRVMKDRNPIVTVLLLFVFMQLPMLIVGIIAGLIIVGSNPTMSENPQAIMTYLDTIDGDYRLLGMLFATILVSISVYIFAKKYQKRNKESLGLTNANKFKNYLKGLLIGLGMIGVVVLILKIMGLVEINSNIANVSPVFYILIIIGWIFQGFEEELVTRSILMNYFAAKYRPLVGIIANSLIFSLLHLANDSFSILPAINIFIVGVLFSLLFYVSDDIMLSASAHSFWNFAQGNIFGISVSGMTNSKNTIFISKLLGNPSLTGGAFGIEGGLATTIVLTIVTIYLIKKSKEKSLVYSRYYKQNQEENSSEIIK
ncbi:CPBP family intramembrane glutamic endopeptidase [Anaerococcus provencensis]|uniref:CPBP family intramembrane glutamic endopeptidase n=1 Tax=Anaerococcus provencensis TaxID=938293 RepID=UPI0003114B15|nr:CPBP family intramembrane glutamic endopeptidase [Anaerococcus provencensis]